MIVLFDVHRAIAFVAPWGGNVMHRGRNLGLGLVYGSVGKPFTGFVGALGCGMVLHFRSVFGGNSRHESWLLGVARQKAPTKMHGHRCGVCVVHYFK